MNKIKTLVAAVALVGMGTAMAAYHSTSAPMMPCKQYPLLSKTDRNQNMFMAQCGWNKRISFSGSVKTTFGSANEVIGG